ncbi:uncharacterized protein LOC122365762 [Amphibalanus amphitrite]|uniref:uncharacterized protein LOC122365762 n=1 Tax=Amphibalanus amphitrite TaxID=1232801 RepID=UPI001C907778|nr:uncharacterized protein LOC122365762 [Amphibalanus amphitrite]
MCVKGISASDCDMKVFPAVAVPVICAPLSRPTVPDVCVLEFKELTLADGDFSRDLCVDILVGLDCYWSLLRSSVLIGSSGLVAQNSCFGWVVSGAVTDAQCSASLVSCRLLCLGDLRDTETSCTSLTSGSADLHG